MTELNFGERVEISRNLATAHSLVFGQCLGTVIGSALSLSVSFSLLIEDQDLIKVDLSAILDHLSLIGLCCVLGYVILSLTLQQLHSISQ